MADVARKVMGDVPLAFVEGAGGERVAEDAVVAVGKHDVSATIVVFYHQVNRVRYFHSKSAGHRTSKLDGVWVIEVVAGLFM